MTRSFLWGFFVRSLVCYAEPSVLCSFDKEERTGCFTLIAFLVSCDCMFSMALHRTSWIGIGIPVAITAILSIKTRCVGLRLHTSTCVFTSINILAVNI